MEDKKALPAGIEWPRFEDETPVRFGDMGLDVHGRPRPVMSVKFTQAGLTFIGDDMGGAWWDNGTGPMEDVEVDHGKRVKRPAPKVLDADGVKIRAGEMVYSTENGDEFTVMAVNAGSGEVHVRWGYDFEDKTGTIAAKLLTHRAPVLAADGKPLEVGQTVWDTNGDELVIVELEGCGHTVACRYTDVGDAIPVHGMWLPSNLTHQRPVLDADGAEIRVGDTVYLLPGDWCDEFPCFGYHGGEKLEVFSLHVNHVEGGIGCLDTRRPKGTCYPQPSQLTHTKTEIDTWERIEEDAGCTATKYNERRGTTFTTKQQVARDLVRRAKALAERGE